MKFTVDFRTKKPLKRKDIEFKLKAVIADMSDIKYDDSLLGRYFDDKEFAISVEAPEKIPNEPDSNDLRLRKQRIGYKFSKLDLINRLIEIDEEVHNYICSEGCGCCASEPEHCDSGNRLTKLFTDLS